MRRVLSLDDVLIVPRFSEIRSRQDVDLTQQYFGHELSSPFISSNMDTVTEKTMAEAMWNNGAIGAIHRFMTIENNVKMFDTIKTPVIVSIGLGDLEKERAEALYDAGATLFLIDVAHGASMEVVKQYDFVRTYLPGSDIIVGNFATAEGIRSFKYHAKCKQKPDAYKIGIGGGSACLTRKVTGCGLPTLASIQDCSEAGEVLIADGGIRDSGDAAKVLAAGAHLIMMGRNFAGAEESPSTSFFNQYKIITFEEAKSRMSTGDLITDCGSHLSFELGPVTWDTKPNYKKYRGSASAESYQVQGKTATHRAPEGDSYLIPYTGPVKNTLDLFTAGIKSACSYVGANNLNEFREMAEFVEVTPSGARESGAHGKTE